MSDFPAELTAHLGRGATTVCHAWKLTRQDGEVLGFTDHDRSLAFGGTNFLPETGFSASEARESLGLAVDTVDVEGALSSERIRDADIAAGLYDGATVETFLVNWREPTQFALLRTATIGRITRADGRFTAELESLAHKLDRVTGRTVSRTCDAELGDARCGFDLSLPGFGGTGTVIVRDAAGALDVSGLDAFAPGWFMHGTLTWTSGALAGRRERIDEHRLEAGSVMLVLRPGGMSPEGGDGFTVEAGCDKRFATCKAKFANALNFRGFPHLPGNDAAYAYVVDGDVFDGGPLVS